MFENFDLSKMGAMLEVAQKQAQKMQEDANSKQFTAKSGGGMVSVSMNGNGEVVDITLDDSLLNDKESLQILLISAMNDVSKMVEDNKKLATTQMLSSIGGFGAKS
ncbi:YbaB/EbfC family nucleoid-associated protein [Sulfurospirillum oryzae]|uniref:YbaB/EbfC family nucleoid-associated protein n=1 Tax=Sulfurospirillum oryzae TaxID=2976535 RepID=UPI0021E70AAA|nr:YbaB/EbfC family nucleoid-associated protein [Sulfurospirillum oryzae]